MDHYRIYAVSHFYKGLELIFLLIVLAAYTDSPNLYFATTFAIWFLSISFLHAPFLFNVSGFEWKEFIQDWRQWRTWISRRKGPGVCCFVGETFVRLYSAWFSDFCPCQSSGSLSCSFKCGSSRCRCIFSRGEGRELLGSLVGRRKPVLGQFRDWRALLSCGVSASVLALSCTIGSLHIIPRPFF